jgi:hypothetical protein
MPIREPANSPSSITLSPSRIIGHRYDMRPGHMQRRELSTQKPIIRSACFVGLVGQGLQ